MAIYTISDLHLPLGVDKPMNIFGKAWDNYIERLFSNWNSRVRKDDTVIVPGDLSWATYLKDSYKDFEFINALNGKKIIMKGNHDYYFTTLAQMYAFFEKNGFDTIKILQNNYFLVEDILICGTRGWDITATGEEDIKLLNREAARLELSLGKAQSDFCDKEIRVFFHYPPILNQNKNNILLELLFKYNVKYCYFGHLHSKGIENAFSGEYNNVIFTLVSADYLKFNPLLIKNSQPESL